MNTSTKCTTASGKAKPIAGSAVTQAGGASGHSHLTGLSIVVPVNETTISVDDSYSSLPPLVYAAVAATTTGIGNGIPDTSVTASVTDTSLSSYKSVPPSIIGTAGLVTVEPDIHTQSTVVSVNTSTKCTTASGKAKPIAGSAVTQAGGASGHSHLTGLSIVVPVNETTISVDDSYSSLPPLVYAAVAATTTGIGNGIPDTSVTASVTDTSLSSYKSVPPSIIGTAGLVTVEPDIHTQSTVVSVNTSTKCTTASGKAKPIAGSAVTQAGGASGHSHLTGLSIVVPVNETTISVDDSYSSLPPLVYAAVAATTTGIGNGIPDTSVTASVTDTSLSSYKSVPPSIIGTAGLVTVEPDIHTQSTVVSVNTSTKCTTASGKAKPIAGSAVTQAGGASGHSHLTGLSIVVPVNETTISVDDSYSSLPPLVYAAVAATTTGIGNGIPDTSVTASVTDTSLSSYKSVPPSIIGTAGLVTVEPDIHTQSTVVSVNTSTKCTTASGKAKPIAGSAVTQAGGASGHSHLTGLSIVVPVNETTITVDDILFLSHKSVPLLTRSTAGTVYYVLSLFLTLLSMCITSGVNPSSTKINICFVYDKT